MIEIENITLTYEGKIVICDFSYSILKGESVCIVGKSGCGKSSILMALLGFIPPAKGVIKYNGQELSAASILNFRNNTAFLSQDISFPQLTVKELLNAPFQFKSNRNKTPSEGQIKESFEALNLEWEIYSKKLNEISGGQKQRILLSLMKLLDKEIVLLDEPTSALDPESVGSVIRFLQSMKGKTIIAVSHDERFSHHFDKTIKIDI